MFLPLTVCRLGTENDLKRRHVATSPRAALSMRVQTIGVARSDLRVTFRDPVLRGWVVAGEAKTEARPREPAACVVEIVVPRPLQLLRYETATAARGQGRQTRPRLSRMPNPPIHSCRRVRGKSCNAQPTWPKKQRHLARPRHKLLHETSMSICLASLEGRIVLRANVLARSERLRGETN